VVTSIFRLIRGSMNPLDRLSEYLRSIENGCACWPGRGERRSAPGAGADLYGDPGVDRHSTPFPAQPAALAQPSCPGVALALRGGLLLPAVAVDRRRAARKRRTSSRNSSSACSPSPSALTPNSSDPFLELLAGRSKPPGRPARRGVTTQRTILGFASVAGWSCALSALARHGRPRLLALRNISVVGRDAERETLAFVYDIVNSTRQPYRAQEVRSAITARLVGSRRSTPDSFAKYNSVAKWRGPCVRSLMPNHEFLFSGIPESLEYYVEAGPTRSKTYK